jgi:hypothetical protein
MAEILEYVKKPGNLALSAELVSSMASCIKAKMSWAVALSLLPLLTNLEGLHIDVGHSLTEFNTLSTKVFNTHFLGSKLRWVHISAYGWLEGGLDVEVLIPLFHLPSITRISVSGIGSIVNDYGLNHFATGKTGQHHKSNVQTLQMYRIRIAEDKLAHLLRLPKALTKFVFVDLWGLGLWDFWDLQRFRETVAHVSNTLNVLILELDDEVFHNSRTWSFHHFNSLTTLSISYKFIWDSELEFNANRLPPTLEILVLRNLRHPKMLMEK